MDKNLQAVFIIGGITAVILMVVGKRNKVVSDLADEPVDDTGIVTIGEESDGKGFGPSWHPPAPVPCTPAEVIFNELVKEHNFSNPNVKPDTEYLNQRAKELYDICKANQHIPKGFS
tara:strand:- start:4603 stop:4953 length:351 start_codon:yes stop_codon:yes gene_type:complete